MRRGNLADFDPTKQLSGEFGVSTDNSAGNQKVFMAFGNGNVKELMTVEDAEAQIGELVDDAVDAAIGGIVDTVTEAAETATAAAQTATTQAGTATTKAGEAASSASSASTDATSAAGSAASADDSAEDSEAWAVGQRDGQDVPATDETYHNNAKYWAGQASQAAGGGVTSFNGRSGSVSPQSGDYTAAMVGLGNVDNTSDLNKPISTATQTALNGKADTSSLTDGSVTKIGTGTVGSATQPVYINGGVPTAGNTMMVNAFSTAYNDFNALPLTPGVYRVELLNGEALNTPYGTITTATWWNVITYGRQDRWTQIATQAYSGKPGYNEVWVRVKHDSTWRDWARIGGGITTGTPTNINSNLSYRSGSIVKTGNVVNARVTFNVNASFTPVHGAKICDMPWRAYQEWTQLNRGLGTTNEDSGWEWGQAYFNGATTEVRFGYGDYGTFTSGKLFILSGTYLTDG